MQAEKRAGMFTRVKVVVLFFKDGHSELKNFFSFLKANLCSDGNVKFLVLI